MRKNKKVLVKVLLLIFILLPLIRCTSLQNSLSMGSKETKTSVPQIHLKTSTVTFLDKTQEANVFSTSTPTFTISPTTTSTGTPSITNVYTPAPQKNTNDKTVEVLCHQVPATRVEKQDKNSDSIFLSGKFVLCALEPKLSAFDLDNGDILDQDNPKSDITLEAGKTTLDNNVFYYIREVNGSMVNEPNEPIPSYIPNFAECNERALLKKRWHHIMGVPGHSGCVLTNEGRVAYIKVTQVDTYGAESIEVSFTTWNKQ